MSITAEERAFLAEIRELTDHRMTTLADESNSAVTMIPPNPGSALIHGIIHRCYTGKLIDHLRQHELAIPRLLALVDRLDGDLTDERKRFAKLYGNHQSGMSTKVIPCPKCGGVEGVLLSQRIDAPELFHLSCTKCGCHATIQLFSEEENELQYQLAADIEAAREQANRPMPE